MKPAGLIPSLQSDVLMREIEQQFNNEIGVVIAAAQSEARAMIAQARAGARARMHEAVQGLRHEGARRLARATAQIETERRARVQQQAAQAINEAMPLLRQALAERWREPQHRKLWTEAVAQLCVRRLRRSLWQVEHPDDWSEPEQRDFATAVGAGDGADIAFKSDRALTAGLRIKADQAVLDATADGLLSDTRTIAALLLDETEAR